MKTGRARGRGGLPGWARNEDRRNRQRQQAAGDLSAAWWGPLPATRPAWLELGQPFQTFDADGVVADELLVVTGIRPNGRGGWEVMGNRTASTWHDVARCAPWKRPA